MGHGKHVIRTGLKPTRRKPVSTSNDMPTSPHRKNNTLKKSNGTLAGYSEAQILAVIYYEIMNMRQEICQTNRKEGGSE